MTYVVVYNMTYTTAFTEKEKQNLVTRVNLLQTELIQSCSIQYDNVGRVNQTMRAIILRSNEDEDLFRKELNKLELKFA